jgi:hypothetical protein
MVMKAFRDLTEIGLLQYTGDGNGLPLYRYISSSVPGDVLWGAIKGRDDFNNHILTI